jgi:hypothetical protein
MISAHGLRQILHFGQCRVDHTLLIQPAESQIFDLKSNHVAPALPAQPPAINPLLSVVEDLATVDSPAQSQAAESPAPITLRSIMADGLGSSTSHDAPAALPVKEDTLDQRLWAHEGAPTMEFSVECSRLTSGVRITSKRSFSSRP